MRGGASGSLYGATDAARRLAALPITFGLALTLGSCRTPSFLCVNPSGLKEISITSSADTNAGRPIAVDVVFITHKPVLQALNRMKARDYFSNKAQLSRDFPSGLVTRSWELQAGQYVLQSATSPPCNLAGTLLFADYAAEGDHRIALGQARKGTVELGPDRFAWSRQ